MSNRTLQYNLHYGSAKKPIAEVIPDSKYPRMWRVRWRDGQLSDLGNLTRVREAAYLSAQRGRDAARLHWQAKPIGQAQRSPPVSPNRKDDLSSPSSTAVSRFWKSHSGGANCSSDAEQFSINKRI